MPIKKTGMLQGPKTGRSRTEGMSGSACLEWTAGKILLGEQRLLKETGGSLRQDLEQLEQGGGRADHERSLQ